MQASSYVSGGSRQGLSLLIITGLLWGTIGIATRGVYELSDANALTVGFFRLAFAAPALLIACWHVHRKADSQTFLLVPRRDLGLMLLMGLAMALYQASYFAAIAQVGVTIAVLVALCTAPVMVALLSVVLLNERLTLIVLLALLCALGGTALLVSQPAETAMQQVNLSGVLLALGAGLSYAVVTVCSRVLATRYHPLQTTAMAFGAGALMLLPFALSAGLVLDYPLAGWALLLHLGLVPTALGYLLFLWGLRSVTATVASIITMIEPLTSSVLAWLLFHEQLESRGWLGAFLLLGAMAILLWQPADRRAA